MTMPFPRKPWVGGIFFTVIGAVLIAFACSAPAPSATEPEIFRGRFWQPQTFRGRS